MRPLLQVLSNLHPLLFREPNTLCFLPKLWPLSLHNLRSTFIKPVLLCGLPIFIFMIYEYSSYNVRQSCFNSIFCFILISLSKFSRYLSIAKFVIINFRTIRCVLCRSLGSIIYINAGKPNVSKYIMIEELLFFIVLRIPKNREGIVWLKGF